MRSKSSGDGTTQCMHGHGGSRRFHLLHATNFLPMNMQVHTPPQRIGHVESMQKPSIQDCRQQTNDVIPPNLQALDRCVECKSESIATRRFKSLFGDLALSTSIPRRRRTRIVSRLKTHACPDFVPVRSCSSIRVRNRTVSVSTQFRSREARTQWSVRGKEWDRRLGSEPKQAVRASIDIFRRRYRGKDP